MRHNGIHFQFYHWYHDRFSKMMYMVTIFVDTFINTNRLTKSNVNDIYGQHDIVGNRFTY